MELLNQKLSTEKQAALDAILAKIPISDYVGLDLPSRGLYYNSTQPIEIRPLGWEDEKALLSRADDGNAVDNLINSALRGITCAELIPMDRGYILFKLREITIGPKYEFKLSCPTCNKLGEVKIDTSEFRINYLPEDTPDPRETILPMSKLTVFVRFQKGIDAVNFGTAEDSLDNLYRLVVSIDGITDTSIIGRVVKKLPTPDLQELRKVSNMPDYGLDTKFMYKCGECKGESLLEAPIGSDFFLKS